MSSRMSRSGERNERKVRSTELSTLAWAMTLKKLSAWRKGTLHSSLTAVWPRGIMPKSSLPLPPDPVVGHAKLKKSKRWQSLYPECELNRKGSRFCPVRWGGVYYIANFSIGGFSVKRRKGGSPRKNDD